jgi:hypothetical protein
VYFDPVWSRLEAGVTVALHIMPFWYFDAISPRGATANPPRGTCRVAVEQHLRRTPGRGHAVRAHHDNVFGRHQTCAWSSPNMARVGATLPSPHGRPGHRQRTVEGGKPPSGRRDLPPPPGRPIPDDIPWVVETWDATTAS